MNRINVQMLELTGSSIFMTKISSLGRILTVRKIALNKSNLIGKSESGLAQFNNGDNGFCQEKK